MGIKDRGPRNALIRDCLVLLKGHDFFAFRNRQIPAVTVTMGIDVVTLREGESRGIPHIFVILPPFGTLVALNIKVNGDEETADEIQFMHELLKSTAKYFTIKNINELIKLINDDELQYLPKGTD